MEEAVAKMAHAGIPAHIAGQALICFGSGMLIEALGPDGAGYEMDEIESTFSDFLEEVAAAHRARG